MAESIAKSEEKSIEKVLTNFALLLDPRQGNKGSLPVVLLLDDAQWMDFLSLRIVQDLWSAALRGKWPLLILATHWQREWNTGFASPGEETFAAWIALLVQSGSASLDLPNYVCKLGSLRESKDILKCAFPGLTEEQETYFVEAASGNPRHISEIILLLQRNPQWFENKDFSRPLTQRWKGNVPKESLKLVNLERERFDAVEDAIKQLLGTASQQGDRFFRAFFEGGRKIGLHRDKIGKRRESRTGSFTACRKSPCLGGNPGCSQHGVSFPDGLAGGLRLPFGDSGLRSGFRSHRCLHS
jgi:hypothetical protein